MAGQQRRGLRGLKADGSQRVHQGGALTCADVAEQQILIWGDAHLQFVGIHQATQACLCGSSQATAEKWYAHKPLTRGLAMPAQIVLQLGLGLLAQALDRVLEIAL